MPVAILALIAINAALIHWRANVVRIAPQTASLYAAIGLRFASRRVFAWGIVTASAICVSTILTKQHYVIDVAAGAALAGLTAYAVARRAN